MPNYVIDIAINASDKASAPAARAESSFKSLAATVGKTLAVGFAAAGAAALAFGVKAVQMASDAEETKSKFNTVFKDMAGEVGAWSDSVSNSMGLTKAEAKGMLASVQDLLVPFGMARDQAADMSQQVLTLAGDMASFNNLNTADVVSDINSALVGETEGMKKYGVILNAAAIEAKALELGLMDVGGELSNTAKASATMALIMQSTSDAQGDLGRTQDSFANQMKSAQASVKDFTTEMGAVLLPMLTPVLGALSDLAKVALPALVDAFASAMETIKKGWAEDWAGIHSTFATFADDMQTEGDEFWKEWNLLFEHEQSENEADWEGWTRTVFESVVGGMRLILNSVTEQLRALRGLKQYWMSAIKGDWEGAWEGMVAFAEGTVNTFLNFIQFNFGADLRNSMAAALNQIWDALTPWASDLTTWWNSLWSSLGLGGGAQVPTPPSTTNPLPQTPFDPLPNGPPAYPPGLGGGQQGMNIQQNFYGMESTGSIKRAAEIGVLSGARAAGIA